MNSNDALNDELKEIDIKNRTCYYFHGIIKIEDFNLDNILTLIRLGLLGEVFSGGGQFDPPFIFQEELI